MTIGECIRRARKGRGLTQIETAQRAHIAVNTLRLYEAGKHRPRLETLQRISDALDVPIGELIPASSPLPDRDFGFIYDTLADAGISIEASGFNDGSGPDGDEYYIWHTDAEQPEEDRVTITFRDLLRVTRAVQTDAEARQRAYIRKRLDAELF